MRNIVRIGKHALRENLLLNGTNISDRVCSRLCMGTYSSMANKIACVQWTNCSKGQKIMVAVFRGPSVRKFEGNFPSPQTRLHALIGQFAHQDKGLQRWK